MKKKKIEHHIYDNNEAGERRYQQKLKADQSMLQMFFSSFSQCFCVPFYPYDYPMFPQAKSFVDQPEDNKNKEVLKKQQINNYT